jgi:F0F1-type ATP synthase assembly protein I
MTSFFGMAGSGIPTIGSLEHHILIDQRMAQWEKDQLLQKLQSEVGNLPKSTPLSSVAGSLGGGVVGWLVAKYFNMGPVGQAVSTAAGFGIGKQIQGVYGAMGQLASGSAGRSSMVRPFL